MEIAKALIIAGRGGSGDSPWPAAPGAPKHLFPVGNQPILFHNLTALRAAGVMEATILAEGGDAAAFERAAGDGRAWGMTLRYGAWHAADGLHGALAGERSFLAGEPVLVQRGDAVLRDRMHGHISSFARDDLDALTLRLTGSSSAAPSGPAPTPGYLLSARAVAILAEQPASASGPLAGLEACGGRVGIADVRGVLPCDGDQDALLECNRAVLEGLTTSIGPAVDNCRIQGAVEIHPTAVVRGATLRGPLIIGPGATVLESYVGPSTSIGEDAVIEGSEIEHSIVLAGAQLRFVGSRVESSVIGRGARVVRSFRPPASLRMSLGDGAEVVIA
ncbi:MAG: glucose-phosphate thymidylyltransferase [Baekduia sp.]|jgi:glucose-1-phosphate thymidylyltransferase|nr:glucose-phosphate thymidylyltransferase [Baekduia sp.]